jgi:hypothetical protein
MGSSGCEILVAGMVRQMKRSAIFDIVPGNLQRVVLNMAKKTRRGKSSPSLATNTQSGRHPIFGALRGTITIAPGVDLTEPADPEWGKVYDDVGRVSESVTRRGPRKRKGGLRLR